MVSLFTSSASRRRPLGRILAGAILFSLCPVGPASAQGLFDLLFGGPKSSPSAQIPAPRPLRAAPNGPGGVFSVEPKRTDSDGEGGTYRTVCVRMCDGYFTPMSFSTTRKNFAQDENKCRASCGGDARLFFYRNPGSTIDEATDLSGRVYARTPNAFRYRKALVEGCTCRPPPWSEASLARHAAYADGPQSPIAGQSKTASVRVADAVPPPVVHNAVPSAVASAEPATASATVAAAEPLATSTKARTSSRRREPSIDAPVKTARAPPKPVVLATAPQSKTGLFGSATAYNNGPGASNGGSMGLGVKPKYVWPGD